MNLKILQAECNAWQNENFPHTPAGDVLQGVGEELGELGFCLYRGDRDGIVDSLGDMGIFAANFANKIGFDIETVVEKYGDPLMDGVPRPSYPLTSFLILASAVGELKHAYLKTRQAIRGANEEKIMKTFANLWIQLHSSALAMIEIDFDTILQGTWDVVKQRNWRKNPQNGDTK